MSHSWSATSKTPRSNFHSSLYLDKQKLPNKMCIPTILGTRYFRDWSRCHNRVRRPQKNPRNIFRSSLYQDERKLPKKMRIPTVLGTRYFRDWSRCNIRVRRPQKIPEIIFALDYTKMDKNSRRRCAYPPSWAPCISGIEADFILAFGDLENPQK